MNKPLITIPFPLIIACANNVEVDKQLHFKEKELSFKSIKYRYEPSNNWIKQPQNLEMIHETFRAIGYNSILEYLNWTEDWTLGIDNTRSLKVLIDSLESTYGQKEDSPKYYREFWQRRIQEGNNKLVYKILNEIKSISAGEILDQEMNASLINDTLKYLCEIEIKDTISNIEANKFLDYLVRIGLHESAWNVRSGENSKFDGIEWEIEASLVQEKLNKSDTFTNAWIEDNTK